MGRKIISGILTLAVSLMLASGASAASTEYCKDVDLDGYGDRRDCVREAEPGYVENDSDCDDNNAAINPGVLEVCGDGIDNNCTNGTDEGCDGGSKQYYYLDSDNDGFGDPNVWEYVTNASDGYIIDSTDCNDQNLAINPGVAEICSTTDLTDENCSGAANEGCQSWWEDADNDSYSTGSNLYDMAAPAGYVLEASLVSTTILDCSDSNSAINPAAAEICSTTDLTDENCSGAANEGCQSWWQDYDNDRYSTGSNIYDMAAPADYVLEASLASTTIWDCSDSNSAINPSAAEICSTTNLTDENCSGSANEGCQSWWQDADSDGYSTGSNLYDMAAPANYVLEASLASTTILDCSDSNSAINPVAEEICSTTDLTDENCSGVANEGCQNWWQDVDSDGYTSGDNIFDTFGPADYVLEASLVTTSELDCNDLNADINPGATEMGGDQRDQNCDGDNGPYFPDPNLETCVLSRTGGNYSETAMAYLSYLSCSTATDLTGMEYLTGLIELRLSGTSISDLTPLSNLTGLERLSLTNNSISDLSPLSNLMSLSILSLDNNSISDLTSLANLSGLSRLSLTFNNISNLTPLANLTELPYLNLNYNSISDLTPLANLSGLTELYLLNNSISDLTGLDDLTGLHTLYVTRNSISDLTPLSNLTGLERLYLANNSISDLTGLDDLTGLTYLNLLNNSISDLAPLVNLSGLITLGLSYNSICDLTPLSNLTGLDRLYLTNNSVSDLTPLANLTGLRTLYLYMNFISDTTPLANLTELKYLQLQGNPIIDLAPLTNLTKLYELRLGSTSISDLTGLENLTALRYLYLNSNSINDLTPLANLTGLGYLDISFNSISDLTPLANLTELGLLSIMQNFINDLTPLANLTTLMNLVLYYNCIADFTPVSHVLNVRGMDPQYQLVCN